MKKVVKYSLVLGAAVLMLSGCGKTSIVGKWGHDSFVYTFNKDNTCTYDIAGSVMDCTYEVEGDKLSIKYAGNTSAFETTYKIEDGVLHITDSFGADITYKKK